MSTNVDNNGRQSLNRKRAIFFGAFILMVLILAVAGIIQLFSPPMAPPPGVSATVVMEVSSTPTFTPTPTSSATPLPTATLTPSNTSTPTNTPTSTPTPTPTLDLAKCNAAGCGLAAKILPTVGYDHNLLLTGNTPIRRICKECPPNSKLSEPMLDRLIGADRATLARLQTIALSQESYEIAPGIVYIVFDKAHHVVIDLEESGYILRNIIPEAERGTIITPSYCLASNSLVVVDADYHGLNGSNKTETGRDLFFHLGRAALFQRDGRFDIDVMRTREEYDPTTISWGGGPLFVWDGEYNYNPKQEWFEQADLDYYRDTTWSKMTVAISADRKYLFITTSYNFTLAEHAKNIIRLGQTWGIEVDRAMRFDGGESAYLAIRLGNYVVPVLNLEEPLIVNCLAVERAE